MLKFASLVLLLASLVVLPAADPDFVSQADALVTAHVKAGRFMGAVLVAKDGKPVLRKGYGFANVEWDVPNTPDTKFRLGSITKQFTAMAVMQLVEAGKVNLDDPVKKYYADAPATWDTITIHHLLTHTSGIPSYTGLPNFFRDKSRDPLKPTEIIKLTQDKPLEFEPGANYKYNNTGYVLLGHVIEQASGEKYSDYVRKHIFEPLGMKDSGYDAHTPIIKKRASGYSSGPTNAPYLEMTLPYAAGSLYSTVDDLLIWDQALYGGKLISKESYDKMFTPVKNDYAYGWAVVMKNGHKQISHGGGINGFNTMFARYPDDKLTVAVFSNVNGPTADRIAGDLARMYFGEKVEILQEKKEVAVAPDMLETLVGIYELKPDFKITVSREGGQLFAQATNQPKFPVYAASETNFFFRVVEAELVFQRDSSGTVTGLILKQNGRDMPAKRL
jgi:CubicO group peptidase (beta-lactamase class C family)